MPVLRERPENVEPAARLCVPQPERRSAETNSSQQLLIGGVKRQVLRGRRDGFAPARSRQWIVQAIQEDNHRRGPWHPLL